MITEHAPTKSFSPFFSSLRTPPFSTPEPPSLFCSNPNPLGWEPPALARGAGRRKGGAEGRGKAGVASWRNKKSERRKPRSNSIVAPGKATPLSPTGTKPTKLGHVLSWAQATACFTPVFVLPFNELPKQFVDALCAKARRFSPVYLYNVTDY